MPITVALGNDIREFSTNINVLSAGAFLSMLIPIGAFLLFQQYFVQATLAGSTK
jgi:alpha-glucoside transport system permease protein